MTPPSFVPGLALNGAFYREIVRPIVQRAEFVEHSAALLGYGSDVLGFDTPQSRDHNWGPRLQLVLDEADFDKCAPRLDVLLRRHLPPVFHGYSVHFSPENHADSNTRYMVEHHGGEVHHLIEITTVSRLTQRYINLPPNAPLTDVEWLSIPEQRLLELSGGQVYYDGLGTLGAIRARYAYFPRRVWLIRLAAQWQRIGQEEPFTGRTGDVGDEIGSWLLGARLTRDVMRLCFLYARRYTPYSKWLGTAFKRLPIARQLMPVIAEVQHATDWREREAALGTLYKCVADEHNRLGLTSPISPTIRSFFDRPYQVIGADRFSAAILATMPDQECAAQIARVGSVDQFSDCVPIHSDAALAAKLQAIYATNSSYQGEP